MRKVLAITSIWFFLHFTASAIAQVNCGEQPKELPPDIQEKIKGDVEGKAQLFTKLLGNAALKGTVEASKTELQQKYKDVDKAQMDRYMSWVSCQSIMQDKSLTTAEKNKLWLDLYHEIIGSKKEKQSDATNSISVERGVIAVKYPKLRNAEFEPTYWAILADKVRVAKSGDTKVLVTLDCNPNGGLSGMAISNSVKPFVAVSCSNELRVANVSTGEVFKIATGPLKSGLNSELLEFGGNFIVSKHSSDPCLLVWGFSNPYEIASLKLLYRMECSSAVRSIAFHEKYGFLAAGLADGTIEIWRLNDASPEKLFSQKFSRRFDQPFQHDYIEDVEFTDVDYSGKGFKLCAHDWGNVAFIIDMPDMLSPSVTTIEYPVTDQVIFSSRMSSNGRLLALGTSDGAVTVWDVGTGKLVAKYLHDDQVQRVDFGSNNDIVVSTGRDKTVKTFRISANAVVDTLNLTRESIALQVNYGRRRFAVGQGTRAKDSGPFYASEWQVNPGGKINPITVQ